MLFNVILWTECYSCHLSHTPTACYLPRPSAEQYQFVYVDGKGEVCSRSSAFTFSAPKPLEELVTLEQTLEGGDGSEDMLVVVPKAELLQVRAHARGFWL